MRQCVVWQIEDGKPGHVNQMRGLTQALNQHAAVEVHNISSPTRWASSKAFLTSKFPPGSNLPAPDLILGAGHATHFAVLAARRAYGGKAVVLMKPTLPLSLFDLCIVPQHDHVADATNVVQTCGVLNLIQPATTNDNHRGLMLIGGPSAAYSWDDSSMIEKLTTIVASNPDITWKLTNSRRTPSSFIESLARQKCDNLQLVPHQQTGSNWVPEQLQQASQVWVTEDSVSMVYESLTSGAAVGILEVPCKHRGRVASGIKKLTDAGWATHFKNWQHGNRLASPPVQLYEAKRCAEIIYQRCLENNSISTKKLVS